LDGWATLPEAERRERASNFFRANEAFPRFEFYEEDRFPVEIEIVNVADQTVKNPRPLSPIAFTAAPVGLANPISDAAVRRPTLSLMPGERQSLIFDVSPWISELDVGEYDIRVLVFSSAEAEPWRSTLARISVEVLPAAPMNVIVSSIPSLAEQGFEMPLLDWIDGRADVARLESELTEDVFDVLAIYVFMSAVVQNGTVEGAPVSILNALPAHFAGFKRALEYEVQRPALSVEEAQQLSDQIRSSFPEVAWRIELIESGGGLLKRVLELKGN
jgi:hypothetical protein